MNTGFALKTRRQVTGRVTLPGSKSMTHRALVAAGLAGGGSTLRGALLCEDTELTMGGLRRLGVGVEPAGDLVRVTGAGAAIAAGGTGGVLDLGNSGTSYRFMLPLAALGRGAYRLQGTPRMHGRPVGALVEALRALGAEVDYLEAEGFPPVEVKARGLAGGRVRIAGDTSSQFVSALLLAGPFCKRDLEVEVTGSLVSGPYVDMTLDVMGRFGITVERRGYAFFRVQAGQTYVPRDLLVEGDVSSASYFWAAAAVTGGEIATENIDAGKTRQGDIGLLDILDAMGCDVSRGPGGVRVRGGELRGIEADLSAMPDMVPTLAAVALFARGRTAIRNVPHLRYKESDRLGAVALCWRRLGADVRELPDGLVIEGRAPLNGAVLDPQNDHRMAMSIAVVGLKVPGVVLENRECVAKSFPTFWDLWGRL